jgi:hypothetical protein
MTSVKGVEDMVNKWVQLPSRLGKYDADYNCQTLAIGYFT